MTDFLIQTINSTIRHDFSFHLIEAIRYHNWFFNEEVYSYELAESFSISGKKRIPVGSLEFVFSFLEKQIPGEEMNKKPINIPKELRKEEFLKRKVEIKEKKELEINKPLFIKSNTKYKTFTEIIEREEQKKNIPDDEYMVSDVVEIQSEWRGFVHHKELLDLRCYSGDFKVFPEIDLVEKMIKEYKNSPKSYTIDVGVSRNGTFLIEIHPFVSCGLYGFNQYKYLPQMFINGYKYLIKE